VFIALEHAGWRQILDQFSTARQFLQATGCAEAVVDTAGRMTTTGKTLLALMCRIPAWLSTSSKSPAKDYTLKLGLASRTFETQRPSFSLRQSCFSLQLALDCQVTYIAGGYNKKEADALFQKAGSTVESLK
jgi:hypothetical protein